MIKSWNTFNEDISEPMDNIEKIITLKRDFFYKLEDIKKKLLEFHKETIEFFDKFNNICLGKAKNFTDQISSDKIKYEWINEEQSKLIVDFDQSDNTIDDVFKRYGSSKINSMINSINKDEVLPSYYIEFKFNIDEDIDLDISKNRKRYTDYFKHIIDSIFGNEYHVIIHLFEIDYRFMSPSFNRIQESAAITIIHKRDHWD